MFNKTVAILMAAYNGQDFIVSQIDSVIAQKNINFKLFISLDKSDDDTYKIIDEYRNEYPDLITVLPYGERFGSACSNFVRLIKELIQHDFQYDFVAFCDQDDIWHEDKLDRAIESLKYFNCDGYSSNVTAFWADGRTALVKKSYKQTEFDYLFEAPGPGCTFVLKKELFLAIRDFIGKYVDNIDKMWMHDWFCYSFARYNGFKWYIDNKPSMNYRQHDKNVIGANHGLSSLVARAKVVVSGVAFNKVTQQGVLLGQQNEKPIRLLLSGSRFSFLKLFFISFKLRRDPIHKLYAALVFLMFFFVGSKR